MSYGVEFTTERSSRNDEETVRLLTLIDRVTWAFPEDYLGKADNLTDAARAFMQIVVMARKGIDALALAAAAARVFPEGSPLVTEHHDQDYCMVTLAEWNDMRQALSEFEALP